MRKLWCTALSMMLATSMTVGSVPVMAQGAVFTKTEAKGADSKTKSTKAKQQKYVEGQAIVIYKNTKANVRAFSQKSAFGKDVTVMKSCVFQKSGQVSKNSITAKNGFTVSLVKTDKYSTKELVKQLNQKEGVAFAQPNYKYYTSDLGNDTYNEYLWGLENNGQNNGNKGSDIHATSEKFTSSQTDASEKVVAVVDTGIDYKNEDLKDIVWNNPYTSKLKGAHGYDFVNADADPLDDNGHGSHCSGIIAATSGNDMGVRGVSGKNNIKVMALKFLDEDGFGDTFGAIGAYNYIYTAQQLGTNVVAVNNSWGGGFEESDLILEKLFDLVGEGGAVTVCAAGNEEADNDTYKASPSNLDSKYLISVAASNEKDQLASFSNYGKESVDIAAPGADILSTVCKDTFNPSIYKNKEEMCQMYQNFSGDVVSAGAVGVDKAADIVSKAAIAADKTSELPKDAIVYGVGEDRNVKVTTDDKVYFGKEGKDEKSLKWSIKDAKEGEIYTLYLPYIQEKSTTPVHSNIMLKTESPKLGEDDWWGGELTIKDAVLDKDGNISKENMFGMLDISGQDNYWTQISEETTKSAQETEMHAYILQLEIGKEGDYTFHIDDFATSKSDMKSERFGKYAFYNGTSMATPYVTGAVAAIANAYPKADAEELRARVLGSAREAAELKDKVKTNGVLDLSKITAPDATITSTKLNEKDNLEIKGYFFGTEPKVTVNGKEAEKISSTDNKIEIKGDFVNKKIDVEVTVRDRTSKESAFFTKGKQLDAVGNLEDVIYGGNMVSSGEKLYYVDSTGCVYMYDPKAMSSDIPSQLPDGMPPIEPTAVPTTSGSAVTSGEAVDAPMLNWSIMGEEIAPSAIAGKNGQLLGNYEVVTQCDAIFCNQKIYTIASLNLGYTRKTALVSFDTEKEVWVKEADVPEELYNVSLSTLAAYNNTLYLIGGYDEEKQTELSTVYTYDVKNAKWNLAASLPEARFGAKAMQADNKLIVTLGGNGKEGCPANLIFDGTNWTVSKVKAEIYTKDSYEFEIPYEAGVTPTSSAITVADNRATKKIEFYTAAIGLVEQGIAYAGTKAEGLGNIFVYDVKEDKYITSEYALEDELNEQPVFAGTVEDKFYVLSGKGIEKDSDDFLEDFFGELLGGESTQTDTENAQLFAMSVSGGAVKIVDKTKEGGKVQGAGSYLPGSDITLKAVPNPDYFVKSFKVGNEVVNGDTYTLKAIKENNNMEVEAQFGAYVSMVMMTDTQVEIPAGGSQQLIATVFPENAENKNVEWTSDDTSVATVDKNGKVTTKSDAEGKTVKITAKATDRNTVLDTCVVTVGKAQQTKPTPKPTPKPVKVKKIKLTVSKKTIKAGKSVTIKAKVTPAKAKNKRLKWVSSNKKYATVNQKGKVTAKKAGKGKTVTITAKATDGSKVIAKIRIKIKK